MDKENAIKEMLKTMCEEYGSQCRDCIVETCSNTYIAERLYDAGYRKPHIGELTYSPKARVEIKAEAVREFTEKLKARLAKFIWKHNIPECIFNDVMADLLKEVENGEN